MSLILIVDDRAINREFLATLLGYAGHRVIEAADGLEALALARAEHPDLVISDVLMPVMDGVEFARQLHADPDIAAIPIIFYTATYRLKEGRVLAESCGVACVLGKPSAPQAILAAVGAALGEPRQPSPPAAPPGTEGLPTRIAAGKAAAHLGDLGELRLRIQKIVEAGLELIGEHGELRQVSEGLTQAFGTVQASSLRLAAVLELGLDLASERQPQALLELFCRAAQDIMNARYAALYVTDGEGDARRAATRGMSEETRAFFDALDPRGGLLEQLLGAGAAHRLGDLDARLLRLGVGGPRPPIRALLAVPVISATRACGWLYLGEALGAAEFSDEDEEFAATLATQLALAYENLHLYELSRRHVAQLETEIAERRRMQEEVQIREEQFRSLAETAVDGIVTADAGGRIVFWNSGAQRAFGHAAADIVGRPVQALIPERYRRACTQGVAHFLRGGRRRVVGKTVEMTALKKDGTEFPIDLSLAAWRSREQVFFTAIVRDISERHEQQEKIARLSRIQAVLSGINAAIVRLHEPRALFDEACRVAVEEGRFGMAWIGLLDADGEAGRFVAGVGPRAFVGQRFPVGSGRSVGQCPVGQALRSRRASFCNDIALVPERGLFLDAAREHGYRSLIALPLLRDQASVGVMVLYAAGSGFFDAKELRLLDELAGDLSFALEYIAKAERLDYLVYYDVLTGLPNRGLIHDRLQQLLAAQPELDGVRQVALLLLNVERFKNINDTFGRHSGDALLKQIAARLSGVLGSSDRLTRLGSDHFAAIVCGFDEAADVAHRIDDGILASFVEPFAVAGEELHITLKIGVALFPSDGGDADTLFANAETALRKAATAGERYLFYAPRMNARVSEKLTLENKLRRALERGEFVLHYQPKLSLKNGEVVGLEALIRWQDPASGLVPPDEFIPLLEETGMIVEVGRWALEQALADCRAWHADGVRPPRIAVNVSAVQLRRKDFLETIETVLARHGSERNHLDLELTESLLMDDVEASVRCLGAVHKLGVKIAVDDFGTGYSSLGYLKRFPIDFLKIDQSFVRDITTDPDAAAICIAVIGLAHNLKLKVIAEGVESEGQMNYLRQHDCDEMQGCLFSPPLPADECARLLKSRKKLALPAADGERKTLLIVDDEPNILSALKRVLRRGDYEILTAESAREGFDVLATHAVQVILSDQRMPEMSGTEFLSRVRELYPDTVRIVLSGYTDLDCITGAINRGAIYRFLTKPWDEEQLREHVREAFRYQKAARRNFP